MLRVFHRRSMKTYPLVGIMAMVGAGVAAILYHQATKDPDIGWIKKRQGMANLRWPYNGQYSFFSPTIDFTSLDKPKATILKVDLVSDQER